MEPQTFTLELREDQHNRIMVAGLTEHLPKTGDEVLALLNRGNLNRTKSATKANQDSSRSHAIFQINIQQKSKTPGITSHIQMATLTLCDLAGWVLLQCSELKQLGVKERQSPKILANKCEKGRILIGKLLCLKSPSPLSVQLLVGTWQLHQRLVRRIQSQAPTHTLSRFQGLMLKDAHAM